MPTDFENLMGRLSPRSARVSPTGAVTTAGFGGGGGAYGTIPAPTPVPPSPYQQTQNIYPNISALTGGAGGVIQSQLAGELSPETIKAIQDQAAAWGVATGMPGSQLQGYRGLRNLGLNVEKQKQQGVENYQSFLANLARTTNDPALLAQIATYNAQLAAAPDPAAAAKAAEDAYNRAIQQSQGGGRIPSVGGLAGVAPWGGGGGGAPSVSPAYGTVGAGPAPIVMGGLGGGGISYGGDVYYGGATPNTAAQNWQSWASGLPGLATSPSAGSFYAGPATSYYPTPNTPAFQPGDFTGINIGDFTPAGGGSPDWGAIYQEAGLPYTDWSNSGIDWSIYE